MSKRLHLPLIIGFLVLTASAGAGQVRLTTPKPGEPVERHLSSDQKFKEWSLASSDQTPDTKRVKVCRVETVCKMRFKEGQTPRTRVRNLVAPLRSEGDAIPEEFTRQVRQALENLKNKQGVVVRFIGYTEDAPLTGRDEEAFGNQLSLSKARAQRVALAMQETLGLPPSAIESEGRGASHALASNDTVQGRALNRRIEVEFWHDDPLQELSDEPQLCPGDGQEIVTRVYDPPWGRIATLELEIGQPVVPPGYAATLRRALTDIADRTNPRLRFIGYTKNEGLDRRTASVYGDDIGLSAARARRAMDILMKDPVLAGVKAEHEGRGYVQSDDVVNTGFTQGQESFVRVQVVYDEPLPLDDYEGVDITRVTQEIHPKSPYELNVMHITVDGKPIDDVSRSSSDIQRCTDVALNDTDIRFQFDNLESRPRLGVAAHPVAIAVGELDGRPIASPVHFRMYTNYSSFLDHAEIRIYEQQQSLQGEPLEVLAIDDAGLAKWQPEPEVLIGPPRELKYLLRVYDAKGNFDETSARPLWLNHEPAQVLPPDGPTPNELLAAYGENDLSRRGIPLGSGTVKVQGSGIPAEHTVWVAGRQVPVDLQGKFAAEEILPTGTHTVEVGVLDSAGNGSLYLRDLEFKRSDIFYVGVADITVSQNRASGPIDLLQGANTRQPFDSSVDGRLAFYVNGKLKKWRLTASADTREGPVKDLFTNFLEKSPESLFRRIDPDYHFPSFGDDGVVEDMAPTLGKFYVKAGRGENYGMWGNFKVGYMGNELAHVDRGLYGANGHWGSEAKTKFGERRMAFDGFAAEPGTISSYEEFRGTGGSVYYLRHQDILRGSERVRIELRDKDSGIVTGVVNLRYGVDYDIDYIQGRLLLSEPLTSTAEDNLLVRSSGLSGNEANLVARYEYAPGFAKLDAVSVGGQGHYWFNDHMRLGLTANSNEEESAKSNLGGADFTFRKSTDSWFKVQAARSEGLLSRSLRSDDGGFGFNGPDDEPFADANAMAYRADLSMGIGDFFNGRTGRVTLYAQNLDAGYSAPGQATLKDARYYGGSFRIPVTSQFSLAAKGDQRTEREGLESRAIELDLVSKLTEKWSISTGVRNDFRKDRSLVVPLTQEQGERTDAIGQVTFDPRSAWRTYAFLQETIASSGGREKNERYGGGGSWRPTERFKIDAEVSDGDLGLGGKIGTSFLYSEQTSLYLNYALENERTDNGRQVRRGSLVSGAKRRLSDSSSVYFEERYQDRESQTGLTHAAGVNLVARERWNFGATGEFGMLRDSLTGAATNRKASGVRMGYGSDGMQFSSAVEYRKDDAQQIDLTNTKRTAWLFRNNFKFSVTPDWRVLGKLNYSISDSSLGDFYGGGYTEAVVGYAYRPVHNDRLNALVQYTYFYNVPTTDQVTLQNTAAEFIQRSHIAAVDLTYDLTADWSVGGKYAYRMGEVSLDRQVRNFFDNAAQLGVLRVDWRFRKNWESLIEGRMLGLHDVSQRRQGALAAVYRYIGKNMKVGAGYNFTDFSDDLTDLRYDHRGAFVNFVVTR